MLSYDAFSSNTVHFQPDILPPSVIGNAAIHFPGPYTVQSPLPVLDTHGGECYGLMVRSLLN